MWFEFAQQQVEPRIIPDWDAVLAAAEEDLSVRRTLQKCVQILVFSREMNTGADCSRIHPWFTPWDQRAHPARKCLGGLWFFRAHPEFRDPLVAF
mgnify:CR=1